MQQNRKAGFRGRRKVALGGQHRSPGNVYIAIRYATNTNYFGGINVSSQTDIRRRIVTFRSIPKNWDGRALELRQADTLEHKMLEIRHQNIVDKLREECQGLPQGVMVAVADRDVSRFQTELARQAQEEEQVGSGALEAKFGTGLRGGDWFGWLKSILDWVDREDAHPFLRPTDSSVKEFPDNGRIAMAADWGTGLYGAPKIAEQIRKQGPFDLLLHLGDVYYSGTEAEVQERMLKLWPKDAARVTRALNSNHEMYSGGFGYFDLEFRAFDQRSSYFAFQNEQWLLLFLDTAYVDHDLDATQVGWINTVISGAGRRKIVLFSHQQLFSRLDQQGPKLKKALSHLLGSKLVKAWYWGHEHHAVLYEAHEEYHLLARCLGNGGIPSPRKSAVVSAAAEKSIGPVSWKRFAKTEDSPSCLVLDGRNAFVEGEEKTFGPHGFMTLEFRGPRITERVYLADGTEIFTGEIN